MPNLKGVWIGVHPDAAMFGIEARKAIKAQSAGMKVDVPVTADTKRAIASVEALRVRMRALASKLAELRITADDKQAEAVIARLQVRLLALGKQVSSVKIGADVDTSKLLAAEARLLGIEAALGKAGEASTAAKTAMNAFFASSGRGSTFAAAGWKLLTGHITLFGGALNRVLPKMFTSVAVWHLIADAVIEILAVWTPAIIAVTAFGVAGADAAKKIYNRMVAVHTVMDATGRAVPPLTNHFKTLAASVKPEVYQLFGDALVVMGKRGGAFNTVAIETGRVLDQLAARFVVAVTSGTGVNKFMENAVTDVAKLGDSIGNLGGIFGAVFRAVPGYAEILLTVGDTITKVLENFAQAAEPVIAFGLALHGAVIYGGAAVTFSLALVAGLAKVIAAFTKFNAAVVLVGANALKSFVSAIAGAIVATVGYSGALISLAASEGIAAAGSVVLADAVSLLSKVPLTVWLIAAAALITGLVFAFRQGKSATQDFTDGLDKMVQAASVTQVIPAILSAQAVVTGRLAAAQDKLNATQKWVIANGPRGGASVRQLSSAYRDQQGIIAELTREHDALGAQYQLVSGRISGLARQYHGTTAALGLLNAAGITTAQITDKNSDHWKIAEIQVEATAKAYAAMGTQAGVLGNDLDVLGRTITDQAQAVKKLNDAWGQFIGDVTGTQGAFDTVAQGFFTLQDHAGKLTFTLGKLKIKYADQKAAIDSLTPAGIALNQAFGDQVVNLDKLFASWRTAGLAGNLFTSGVKSGIAPLVKYAAGSQEATAQLVALAEEAGYQGPISMQALVKWLGNTHGATQKLKDITNTATEQEALLTGAMQAQGSFIANQLLGDINNAALNYFGVAKAVSAYGVAIAQSGKGSDAANKAMKTAIAGIVASEQAIGDNSSQMAAIVAKAFGISVPAAMKLVQAALDSLVSKLPPGQKKFELFAINGLKMTADQAGKLWKKFSESNLGELANKAGTTRESFDKLASKGLGISTDAADKLWLHLRRQYLDELARKGNITKGRFIELAEKGLGYTRDKAQALWDTLNRQRLVDASRKAGETKTAFEHLAEKLGYSKQQADKLWDSLHRLTASGYTANVKVNAQGYVNVNGYQISAGAYFSPHAEGGFISGGIPNRDSVPAMLMPGEVVVPVRDVQAGAVDHLRGRLPGFAAGGVVSRPRAGIPGYAYGGKVAPGSKVGDTGDLHTNFPMQSFDAIGGFLKHSTVQIAAAATKAFARYVKSITAAGTGGSIVAYARSFLGKIPYQFGGTTLKGMDCSGFTGMVYRHAGYKSIPRTSEAQGMWAQKTDKPQTGGLAFYHSPAGGPDPGHVAIIDAGGKSVISQGGGLGPKIQRLRYMPLLWTGVPPGGFAQAKLAGGKGPAAAQAWMHSHLADYNWGENQWGSLQGLWDGESGWRWNARNPSSGAYGIPQCMDTHTKILTRRGWLGHDEVRTGDETIGYNQVTGKSEWTLVTDVLHPGPAEIMRFGISRWSVRSTPNHRWLMERLVNDKPVREEMIELQNHEGRKHRVVLSRPAHTEGTLDITVHEAALLGWIAGDGWQVQARVHPRKTPDRGRKNHHRPMTYYGVQVRAKRWDYFENLLQGDPHLTITRERDTGGGPKAPHGYGVREWRMSAPYARDLTERAGGNPKEAAVEQVLAMSTEQREAWLKTIMACDGYFGERHTQISQKEGPISDAVCLALYLSGKSPSVYKDERYENTVLTIGITEPYIGMRLAKIEPAGVTEVWCVRTDLGTWTAQQDGRIFLTGNSLPASKMASAGADWLTNPVTQMRWGASYIRSVYGNPNSAYTRWLGRHPHWYGEGGRIPGMAAGGTVAGLRATLAAEEASERAKYFGLVHSFAIGPAKYRTKTVTGELATLAKRQVTEQAAYAALAGKGLTTTRMHHLGATARAEALTAADQGLSKMPGGHPGWARDLRKYLGQISTTASGSVPAGSTGGQGALNLPTGKQLKFWLGAAQYGELRKYFGLAHSFAIGPAKYRTKTVMSELGTLAKRQASEAAAYKAVISGAMTNAELRHLGATARAEYGTAKDQALNKLPGGHPLFARDLRTYLAQISRLTGTLIPGSGVGASGGAAGGAGGSKPAGPPADSPGLRHIYGGDVGVFDSIAPVLAAAMAPFAKGGMARLARGGMLPVNSFDRGGMLPTGASIAWNGTGSPEPVGGGQCVTVTLEIAPGGNTAFEQLLHGMIRKYVRVRGGGSVQRAYSTPGRISGGVSWNTSG